MSLEPSTSWVTGVDYDLSVDNDHMSAAPIVNEIKSTSEPEETLEEIVDTSKEQISSADSGLLQQIVADLSNLKAEINSLKSNLEEMKSAPVTVPSEASGVIGEENPVEEEIIEDNSDNADTGFFSGDDEDDTIALSTDELTNILNTADFNNEEEVVEHNAEEEADDSPFGEEGPLDEGIIADEIAADNFQVPDQKADELTYDFTDENLNEPNLDDIEIDEDTLDDDLPEEISIPKEDNILVESSSSDFMDSVQDTTEDRAAEEALVADEPAFSTVDNLFEETTEEAAVPQEPSAEEPVFEEEPAAAEEPVFEEEPAAQEAFAEEPVAEEPVVVETIVEEEPVIEETIVPEEPVVEDTFIEEEPAAEEPVVEETVAEEPAVDETDFDVVEEDETIAEEETFVPEEEVMQDMPVEETVVEEPVVDEPVDNIVIPEPELENDFVSHEDENNDLTESNIDYLTTEENEASEPEDENAELKKDIKSVLLYMDQLLENLPEEKIVEFAKSDEFTTYKKLFSELGLS